MLALPFDLGIKMFVCQAGGVFFLCGGGGGGGDG